MLPTDRVLRDRPAVTETDVLLESRHRGGGYSAGPSKDT